MSRIHCFCNLRDSTRGGMVDPDLADHIRDGIPLCGAQCASRYDMLAAEYERQQSLRLQAMGGKVNGHHGGLGGY